MKAAVVTLRDLSADERAEAIQRAAADLDAGRLIVLPTETVYGVASRADTPGLDLLRRATDLPDPPTPPDGPPPLAWHAGDAERIRARLHLPSAVARRLAAQLLPGPVHFVLEQPAEVIDEIRAELGIDAGIIDNGRELSIRVPASATACDVLDRTAGPVVAARIDAARWSAGTDRGRLVGEIAPEAEPDLRPASVLDDGPTRYGRPSTRIRLGLDGAFDVAEGGAIDESEVMKTLERTILFVCTGNTCRSPMAAALAERLLSERPEDGIATRVLSAGVAAGTGMAATPEAVEAMRRRGIELGEHRSRLATPQLVAEADTVYTMTPSHAEMLMRMAPDQVQKIEPLDPHGIVPDPVGLPLETYIETADRLEELIRRRLEELEP